MIVFSTHKTAAQKKALRFSHLREKVSVSGRREALILRGAILCAKRRRPPSVTFQASARYVWMRPEPVLANGRVS
eukprot:COSAG06_NODE_1779_length_8414_cov_9.276248_5_plen_75_part_00